MTKAVLCCTEEQRGWEIRQALSDAGVEVTRQYASTQALLASLAQYGEADTDVLVIDQSSSPMPMWDLSAEVSGRYPAIAVLAVVDNPTRGDYATALDSGARGVIEYPLNFENVASRVQSATTWGSSLRRAVRRTLDEETSDAGGKMVVLASAKGGAGSSTLALHLALESARTTGRRVVLVDLDLQKPDQSILLDAPRKRDITDLLPVVDELSPRFLSDVLFEHPGGFSVLFGPQEGERGELVTEAAAKKILGMLRSRFDTVIVDIGSVMGEANATAAEMADEVCVVTQANVLALRGVRRLTALWERIGARRSEHVQVILNGVDKRSDIQPEAAKKIVGLSAARAVIPRMDRPLEQAVNRRDPLAAGPEWSQRIQQLGRELDIVPPESLADGGRKRRSTRAKPARGGKKGKKEKAAAGPVPEETPALSGAGASGRSERGQSSIEFVGLVTLFLALAVIAFQLLLTGATWVFASHSAAEGARAAAVGKSAEAAARDRTPGAWRDGMSVQHSGDRVSVTLDTPMLVKFTEDFTIKIPASAGVVREP